MTDLKSTSGRVTPWDPAARHRFVTSDGTALHVRDTGPVEGSGSVTLLLSHGWTLDHTSWDRVVAAWPKDRPVRVVRYDHRGHGGSAPAPDGTATIAQVADDLAELITERVPTGPVVLVGHSMGGMTAMALAERHPDLFASRIAAVGLVATSSGGLSELTLGLPKWLATVVARIERRLNRGLARLDRPTLMSRPTLARPGLRWLLFGSRARQSDVIATAAQVGRCHPASMAGFRESLDGHERREALVAMRDIPVTLLAGGADRLTALSHARVIAAELPGAEFVVYPKAGHMLPYERDAEVAAHITALVDRVSRRQPAGL
jgi:pimeloyl-ACP methyl ester carboxylesterase